MLANTGRKRLNIIGAINPVTFEPTIMLTEENCCAEVIEAFLGELRRQYSNATSICIILDNASSVVILYRKKQKHWVLTLFIYHLIVQT